MISVSASSDRDPRFQQNFLSVEPRSILEFQKIILSQIWSPIVWQKGIRQKAAFLSSTYMALDFDSGDPSLAEIKDFLEETKVAHILATTKSHQLPKTSATGRHLPAVDRFRLILAAEEACTDRELYEYNLTLLIEFLNADKSCADGARFFYPSKEIVSVKTDGRRLPWLPFDDEYVREDERYAYRRDKLRAMGRAGLAPAWVQAVLFCQHIVPPGERHKTAYRLACNAAALGWDEEFCIEKIMATSIADIGEADVRRCVENGYRAELGELG